MYDFSTLVELLRHRAQYQSDKTAFIFLQDGETESARLTYCDLDQQACAIATQLQSLGLEDERALLLYAPELGFITAFFGCLYARVVPVPAYPPRSNQSMARLKAIIADADAKIALTTTDLSANIQRQLAKDADLESLHCLATDNLDLKLAEQWHEPSLNRETLAFLQYTSGSTGNPKGVMVNHGNLLHNSSLIHHCFQDTSESRGVSWLPPYHDMGLIGGVLQPIYVGAMMTLMPPVAFLQRPLRWLKAISNTQATTSGAPNFAYDLCVQQIKPEQQSSLDLSHWQLAFTGAEPVRAETLERFAKAFGDCGFRSSAFYPCYGMAETTLIATGGQRDFPPVVQTICETALAQHQVLVIDPSSPSARSLVSSGRSLPDQQVVIANPETLEPLGSSHVGEIWVAGPSVAQGYWQQPEHSQQTFQAHLKQEEALGHEDASFLRTGDLGFIQDGELFITGRLKDLIIIRGRNHYPQDIEATVSQSHEALRPACGAAFSMEVDGEECLVITQEVQRTAIRSLDSEAVTAAIRKAVVQHHQLQPWRIVLLKTGSIPKTSSGKIQRFACRQGVLEDSLNVVGQWLSNASETSPASAPASSIQQQPQAAECRPTSAMAEAIQDWLRVNIAQRLGVTSSDVDPQQPFAETGLDSLAAVQLTGELQDWLGRSLSPTLIYDYPSVAALAQYLGNDASPQSHLVQNGQVTTDEIAIIGMGCRFPGANSPEAFWDLLSQGRDAIQDGCDRLNMPGGYLEQVDQFDAQFFGISPREAEYMDPQQRLLLEVAWETLEQAGIAPEQLAQTKTGVFVGMSSSDYAQIPQSASAYAGTGNAHSIAANRLSYLLDLRGPSLAVDTACSSSLVAVHLASQSIRQGECDQALVGGVNLLLSSALTETFAQAGMLAADGRCKTFDASADGYVRGEGCGVVMLKRLSQAQADGDNILAVIRGSAVNQDGRSNGLTAPNGPAQQAVIRQALAEAQVMPAQLSYVDAHGTGTSLGDPIEMSALKTVLLQDRSADHPCWIGSVKTNIGHLEAAAGIAGLLKIVLALQNEEIPPHLHLNEVNELIDLKGTPLAIPQQHQSWPPGQRLAGVSSFGFGGTNAHVVIEAAPEQSDVTPPSLSERPCHLLTLSAKTEPALRALAHQYLNHLKQQPKLADLCYSANTGRSLHEHRFAAVADSISTLEQQLTDYLAAQPSAISGTVGSTQTAFLFTGQGSQYVGMGRQLYETQPIFRAALESCDRILRTYLDKPLLEILYPAPQADAGTLEEDPLNQTGYTQPALFAVEYALCQLWQSWGIQPQVVMGHSVGEYVAACIAGVFSLEDGLKLIATRSRLMQELPRTGAMVAIFASVAKVKELLQPYAVEDVTIAAYNGPENIVISGRHQTIESIVADLTTAGIKMRWLRVSHAFHSSLMAPMLDAFRQVAKEITYHEPRLPLVSNVTGEKVVEELTQAEYWCQHILEPVRFATSLQTLQEMGCQTFLEVGPQPVLLGMGRRCLPDITGAWLPSLRSQQPDWPQMLQSLGELYVQGVTPDWSQFEQGFSRQRLPLPTYPWQRQRYWIDGDAATQPTLSETSVVQWIRQGESEPLTHLVQQAMTLAPEQEDLLPQVVETLVQQHQQELKSPLADYLYQVAWQPQSIVPAEPPLGRWLLLMDDPANNVVVEQLEDQGQNCLRVYAGSAYQQKGQEWWLNPNRKEDWERLWASVLPDHQSPLIGILQLWNLSSTHETDALTQSTNCQAALNLLQTLTATLPNSLNRPPRIWMVTKGAVALPSDLNHQQPLDIRHNLAQSSLWGLGKVLALEHPLLWGGLIDVEEPDTVAQVLLAEVGQTNPETQVAIREEQRYVARLQRFPIPISIQPPGASQVVCHSEGTYLITGGLGALGLQVAQWLVTQGARTLVLVGRNAPSAKAADVLQRMRVQGIEIETVQVDICDRTHLANLKSTLESHPSLRGVIHAAGVLKDGLLQQQTWEQFQQVMAPKVMGAWNLHILTKDQPLDFFVLFSSAASLLGSPGQGNYAAANAFMDALAHFRHQQQLPALSINWGPWAEAGMAANNRTQTHLAATGMDPIPVSQGLRLLGMLISKGRSTFPAQVGVLSARWSELGRYFDSPYLQALADAGTLSVRESKLFDTLKAMAVCDRADYLTTYLQQQLAHVLHLKPDALDVNDNLVEKGVDSLMIMESMNQLQQDLQLMLYPREFYERPQIKAFAAYLTDEFERSHGISPPAAAPVLKEEELPEELQTFAVPVTKPLTEAQKKDRLPGIVFILSSPRSGSTLLRVMLAGHPRLLSTPELHLLPFETMAERAKDLSLSNLGEGLQRVLMDLKGLGVKASQALIQDLVQRSLPVQNVYAMLQDLAGSRLLVDKSPTYAMSLETLGRAEELFDDAKYIHLVRHPYAMIESFVRMRMDKLIGAGDGNPYRIAESIWTRSNQNVLQFAQTLGSERHHLVHYEDLVSEPQKVMKRLCTFLGVPFDPSMLQPYEGQRMTDGLHQQSLSLGDPNFLKHNRVEKALGDAWKKIRLPHQLGNFARHITVQLGYELPEAVQPEPGTTLEETTLPLNGLELCVCSWGPKDGPLVLCLHGILEQGAVWDPMATQLAAQGYRVIAPDMRGHGRSRHVPTGGTYRLQDFLADLDQLVKTVTDQPITLVGHSLGSVITALFASIRPQQVQQLVLIETILPGIEEQSDPANQLLTHLDYVAAPPQHPHLLDIAAAADRLRQATPSLSPKFAHLLAKRVTQEQEQGVQWRWDPILRTRTSLRGAPFNREGYLQLLQGIKAPVTLVYGDRSRFNRPQDLADQQAALPHAQRIMLSGGHNIHLDATTELTQKLLALLPPVADQT